METTTYFCSKHRRMRKIIFGLLLITSGILWLGFNSGLIDESYRHIIFSWPMILIAIGFLNLFGREHAFSGIVLLLVGGFFLLPHLMLLPENFEISFWPALLIIVGILMIAKRTVFYNHFHRDHHDHFNHERFHDRHFRRHTASEMKSEDGYIIIDNVFGGGKHKVSPGEFKGGRISNVFGGTELDLTQTTLAPGTNILDVECIFGGMSIIVPSDWTVNLQASSILGGFVDKRNNVKSTASDRELIIKGSAIFGGGDIKSY
jgi:predicted membrane protein